MDSDFLKILMQFFSGKIFEMTQTFQNIMKFPRCLKTQAKQTETVDYLLPKKNIGLRAKTSSE